jgi:Fe2+ or Zn2+ uptake regulation protein
MLPQPFTAEHLEKACQSDGISSGTIYNCLQLFLDAQIIHATKRQKGHQATEYELITGNSIRMQRICQKCGRTTNFRSPAIDYIIREQKTQSFFMQHYTLLLYGECRKCKMLEAKAKKKAKA